MLEMVPLSNDDDEIEAAGDPSATAFFAIPAPKAERARATGGGPGGGPPPPPAGIGAGLGTGAPPPPGTLRPAAGGAPPQVGRAPMGQPPPAAVRGPVAGPGGVGAPPAPGGIQGPVASYGGNPAAGGAQTPFQVAAPGGTNTPGGSQQRVKSQVVWVVLFGALIFIGAAALLAVYLVRHDGSSGDDAGADASSPRSAAVGDSKPRTKSDPSLGGEADAGSDTGLPRPKPKKRVRKSSSSGSGKRSVGSGRGSSSGAASGASRAKTPSGPATLSVRIPGIQASAVEVTCPSGVRKRATVSGEAASVPGVPQEDCTLFLKGGAPGKYGPVKGGQSLSCSMSGVTLRCR